MFGPEKRHTRQIYVALLNQGNDAWRCVEAEYEDEDSYRILSENTDPQERWEYNKGECVRCRSITLPDGNRVLVATELLHPRADTGHD